MERLLARQSTGTIVAANGTALSYNANRAGGFIQNLSTVKLYVKKGAGCSDTDFHGIIVGGTATDDGLPTETAAISFDAVPAAGETLTISLLDSKGTPTTVTLTAGVRWTHDKRSADVNAFLFNATNLTTTFVNRPLATALALQDGVEPLPAPIPWDQQ